MLKITRSSAETLIKNQLSECGVGKHERPNEEECKRWHYGKCELMDLLDAIYGPNKEE